MKKQYLRSGYIVITLLAMFFAVFLSARSAESKQKSLNFVGTDFKIEPNPRIVLTLTEYKTGVYTAAGTFYFHFYGKEIACPIKGTYYEKSAELKATAICPGQSEGFLVDGYSAVSAIYPSKINTTVTDRTTNRSFFAESIVSMDDFSKESAEPKGEKPSVDQEPKTEEGKDAVPVIEGNKPSPPEKKEEWNGRWRIKAKSSTAIEGNQPVVKESEFEVQTIGQGQAIRLIGDREMVFNLSPSNPNVATFREQRKETIPSGWGDVIDKRVVFLRDGRLYLTIQQNITSHITLPGLPAGVGHAVNSTIGIGDRVK